MTRGAIAAMLVIAGVAAGCSVDRKSSALACERNSDCHDGRHCDRGYCVNSDDDGGGSSNGCPPRCTSCDLTQHTCAIDCDTGNACGDIECPTGFSCTIQCNANQACGDIDCGIGGSCDITCNGPGACGDIDCELDCRCDVHCNGSTACGDMDCPLRAVSCTRDKQAGAACDSSVDATCNVCQ